MGERLGAGNVFSMVPNGYELGHIRFIQADTLVDRIRRLGNIRYSASLLCSLLRILSHGRQRTANGVSALEENRDGRCQSDNNEENSQVPGFQIGDKATNEDEGANCQSKNPSGRSKESGQR